MAARRLTGRRSSVGPTCFFFFFFFLLARNGVEINKSAADGLTALMLASQNGHVDVVQLLLAREGVEVNKTGPDGLTALMVASQDELVEVVRLLLLASQDVEVNKTEQIRR